MKEESQARREFVATLVLLREDIQAAPMLAAELREQWVAQLSNIIRLVLRDAHQ